MEPDRPPRASESASENLAELSAHADFLQRLAQALLRDAGRAQDVVQDTLLAALEHPPRERAALRGWLARVVRNRALNAGRTEQRRLENERRAARPERVEGEEQTLEQLELQRFVSEAVLALSEPKRTVVYLRFYEGLTPAAIAERLGAPVKTVKSHLHRALEELRARLDGRFGGERERWMAALLPLARRGHTPVAEGASTAFSGALALGAFVLGLAVLVAFWGWPARREEAAEPLVAALAPTIESERAAQLIPPKTTTQREELGAPGRAALSTTGVLIVKLSWSDGTPAMDVALNAWCFDDPLPREERFSSRTDEQGIARLDALFPGDVHIELDRGDSFWDKVEAGTTRTIEHKIPEGVEVEGVVVDLQGEPVARAEIWLDAFTTFPNGMRLTTTAADGTFHASRMMLSVNLGARGRDHLPSSFFRLDSLPAGPNGVRTVTPRLGEIGGSVAGRVIDPDGQPVVGAVVHGGPLRGRYVEADEGPAGMLPRPGTVETDSEGWFQLPDGLPAGRQPIVAVARCFPAWRGEVVVSDGATARIEIHLANAATVVGQVLLQEGKPAADVKVEAGHLNPGEWIGRSTYSEAFPPSRTATDEEGRFELGLVPAGEVEVNAYDADQQDPDLGRVTQVVTCISGQTTACELCLGYGRTISGKVVDVTGGPLAGWLVRDKREGEIFEEWFEVSFEENRTDAQGRFLLINREDGAHTLSVFAQEGDVFPRAQVFGVRPGPEEVVVAVRDTSLTHGRFRGHLLDTNGDVPRDFQLELRPWTGAGSTIDSSVDVEFDPETGAFEKEIRAGSFVLEASQEGDTFAVFPRFVVHEDGDTDVGLLTFPPPGYVEVTVRGMSMQDVERLRWGLVGQRDSSGGNVLKPLKLVDSSLRSGDLSSRKWRVDCFKESGQPSLLFVRDAEIEVVSGETKRVVVETVPGFEVKLICRDAPAELGYEALDGTGARIDGGEAMLIDEECWILLPEGRTTIRLSSSNGLRGQVVVDVGPALATSPPIEVELR